jgi:membrane protein GlpM
MPIELIIKAALGAGVVLVIHFLSKSNNFYIAGLIPLFPTFALIAHVIIGTTRPTPDLKMTVVFGMLAVLPYLTYLACILVLVDRLKLLHTLALAVFAWCVVSFFLIVVWRKLYV